MEWRASLFVISPGTIPSVSGCWEGLVLVATAATEIDRAERNSCNLNAEVLLWAASRIKIWHLTMWHAIQNTERSGQRKSLVWLWLSNYVIYIPMLFRSAHCDLMLQIPCVLNSDGQGVPRCSHGFGSAETEDVTLWPGWPSFSCGHSVFSHEPGWNDDGRFSSRWGSDQSSWGHQVDWERSENYFEPGAKTEAPVETHLCHMQAHHSRLGHLCSQWLLGAPCQTTGHWSTAVNQAFDDWLATATAVGATEH